MGMEERERRIGRIEGVRERKRERESADEDRFFMTVSDEIKACILSTMLQEWLEV